MAFVLDNDAEMVLTESSPKTNPTQEYQKFPSHVIRPPPLGPVGIWAATLLDRAGVVDATSCHEATTRLSYSFFSRYICRPVVGASAFIRRENDLRYTQK